MNIESGGRSHAARRAADGVDVPFQLRPAAYFYRNSRYQRVHSIVEIRNNHLDLLNYIRLLRHWHDILDMLSFEFGICVPTTSHYSLLMYAQQPPSQSCL